MLAYKAKCKELTDLCEEKMKGTKYDKYWVESLQRRFSTVDKLQPIIDALVKSAEQDEFVDYVLEFLASAEEKKKIEAERAKKQEVKAEVVELGWEKEEIANLTKAITKFPPGTVNRWNVIAQFV